MKRNSKKITITNKDQMCNLAKELAIEHQNKNMIIGLYGTLGSGKTFFAKCYINNFFFDKEVTVTSPSFNILNQYQIKQNKLINHFDLYRIKTIEELENIGFKDLIDHNINLIEWPEIIENELVRYEKQYLKVKIQFDCKKQRVIEIDN